MEMIRTLLTWQTNRMKKEGQNKYNVCMEKIEREDVRRLTQKTQEQLRKQGIRLRQKGKTYNK